MSRWVAFCTGLLLVLAGIAMADEQADRDKLIGKWQEQGKDASVVWLLETKGNDLHVAHTLGGKEEEFQCNLMGRDCDVKLSGHKAKVSMWYNGPMLVELETRGAEIVKRRFRIAADGQTMEVENIPVMPAGKPTVTKWERTK